MVVREIPPASLTKKKPPIPPFLPYRPLHLDHARRRPQLLVHLPARGVNNLCGVMWCIAAVRWGVWRQYSEHCSRSCKVHANPTQPLARVIRTQAARQHGGQYLSRACLKTNPSPAAPLDCWAGVRLARWRQRRDGCIGFEAAATDHTVRPLNTGSHTARVPRTQPSATSAADCPTQNLTM